jgi:uncharacterized protein YuzE
MLKSIAVRCTSRQWHGGPVITYSESADALYLQLAEADVASTIPVDDARIVDYAADGSVVGVEFLGASAGLRLEGLPQRDRLEGLIKGLRFPIFA